MGLDCASAGSYSGGSSCPAQCLLATCLTNLSDSPFFPLHRILLVGVEIGSFQHRATQSILLYLSPDLVPRYATAPACRFQSSSSPRPSGPTRSPSATVTSGAAQAGRDGSYQGSFNAARQQWYQGASYSSYYASPYYRSWLQRTAMGAEVQRQNWQNLMQFQQNFAAQAKDLQAHQDPPPGKTQSAIGKKTVFNLLPHCKDAAIDVVFSMSVTITA